MDGQMFVEVTFANGEMIRTLMPLDYYDAEYPAQFGEWNKEQLDLHDNFGYGIIETLSQSDDYSGLMYRPGLPDVTHVRTWLAGDTPVDKDALLATAIGLLREAERDRMHATRSTDEWEDARSELFRDYVTAVDGD